LVSFDGGLVAVWRWFHVQTYVLSKDGMRKLFESSV
jgi:hypothetical protein